MVCDIWYENGIHSVFAYVSHALHSGCLQRSASIPCGIYKVFYFAALYQNLIEISIFAGRCTHNNKLCAKFCCVQPILIKEYDCLCYNLCATQENRKNKLYLNYGF